MFIDGTVAPGRKIRVMALEIERKFLVTDESYKAVSTGSVNLKQCYLSDEPAATVRVRIMGDRAFLTVKGLNRGIERNEWEYPVPVADAVEMSRLCPLKIEKTRWYVPFGSRLWEVDEFHGALQGLVLAEVELDSPDTRVELPPFVGREVSDDPRYYNSSLVKGLG